jgi:branched-chain amino acid transport system ATP-binding protein
MILELKNLVVHYEKVRALKGISLAMTEKSIVTLIGANGAGKSTTLKTISGLKQCTSGEVWFLGQQIHSLSPHGIVGIGIAQVPEGRRVFPYMSVYENLLMGAYLRKDREEIQKDFEVVYQHFPILKDRKNQASGSLSGGEQQMLAMGRALMAAPKLLLLDEPSLGLSPVMVKEIGRIILNINRQEGVSIILVEQNARMALKLSSQGYVLETGKIVLSGPSGDLLNNDHVRRAYLGG